MKRFKKIWLMMYEVGAGSIGIGIFQIPIDPAIPFWLLEGHCRKTIVLAIL